VGQCGDGELLLVAEDRANGAQDVPHTRWGQGQFVRLHRTLLQSACNHVGWADSLWMAYAVYPRQLRYMSKEELCGSTLSRWVLKHGGSVPIDRADPSPSSIKNAVDILQRVKSS
jgi:hypothetical protein